MHVFQHDTFFILMNSELQSDLRSRAERTGRIEDKFAAVNVIQRASLSLFLPLLILAVSLLYLCQLGPCIGFVRQSFGSWGLQQWLL